MRRLISFCAPAILAAAGATAGAAPSKDDLERADAARQIFGDGLSVTRSGDKVTVDWNPDGLTEARARRYLDTYWGPALDAIDPETVFTVRDDRFVFPFYTGSLSRTRRAYFLMEPDGRREICRRIAASITDAKLRKSTDDHCTVRAVETANRGVLGFAGKKATYNADAPWAGIWFKRELWVEKGGARQMLLVAPGPVDIDQYEQLKYVASVADIGRNYAGFGLEARRRMRPLLDRARAKLARREALTGERDTKFAGSDAKIAFTDYPISGWRRIWPLAEGDKVSCYESHAHTYGPAKPPSTKPYRLEVKLNGQTCKTKPVGHRGERVREHSSIWNYCPGRERYQSGDNTVEVSLVADGGAVAARGSMTCTTR